MNIYDFEFVSGGLPPYSEPCKECGGRGCHDDEPDTLPTKCQNCNGTGVTSLDNTPLSPKSSQGAKQS
jgi:DnaJ-class molecular chaperone